MNYFVFLTFPLFFPIMPVMAESHPEYFGMQNPSEYFLKVDENSFTISYEVNANVLAMEIDSELKSLLIGLNGTSESIFIIDLDDELITAENKEFAVLVNGYEVDYDIVSDSNSSTLTFYVPEFSEEVEIIGTHVIPEFPLGSVIGFTLLMSSILIMSARKKPVFRL